EMVNFILDLAEMPTPAPRPTSQVTPLRREDVPAILLLAPEALRVTSAAELEQHLLHNRYFGPEAVYVLRSRADSTPIGVGILVQNASYGNPKQVDAAMPCFRLGSFGTEGMQTKRLNGLFSFLAKKDA